MNIKKKNASPKILHDRTTRMAIMIPNVYCMGGAKVG